MRFLLRQGRLILVVLVVAAIAAAALWPETMDVDVAEVERGAMQVTIDEEGETRVRERFVVSAPVAGRLQRIALEPGDRVTEGETLLARLMPTETPLIDARTRAEFNAAVEAARAAVGQARAERARAAAALERAESTLRRQQQLADAGAISRDAVEAADTAVATSQEAARAAEFTVSRAEYELELARTRLEAPAPAGRTVPVVAPVDGVVLRRLRESESVVMAGEPLVEIGDPGRLEIVSDLLSTDAVQVMPGMPVVIEQWGGSHALHAQVRRVEPAGFTKVSALGVEEQRVNVVIDLLDPAASQHLGDGFRVEVRIVIWEGNDVTTVPVGSLFRRGEEWGVFVVDGGVARLRTVEVGRRNDTVAQVTSGLEPGQTVVMHPPDTLTDGAAVAVRATSAQ